MAMVCIQCGGIFKEMLPQECIYFISTALYYTLLLILEMFSHLWACSAHQGSSFWPMGGQVEEQMLLCALGGVG